MTPTLAERLKNETRALHASAERSAFMVALLGGRMERPAYCALLRNLQAIYAVLEPALERHASHPVIAPVFMPALWRTPSLEHDLRALHGPHWRDELPLEPATRACIERLRGLEARQPELLLAHAYVRYLGDLSGGQMMRDIVARSATLDGAVAVAFYDFGDAVTTLELTRRFRAGLAGIPADERLANALVDEARRSFEMHQRLFAELPDPTRRSL